MTLRMLGRGTFAALFASAALPALAQGTGAVVRESVFSLEVDVVAVGPATQGSLGTFSLTAARAAPSMLEAPLGPPGSWPGGTLRLSVRLDRILDDEATLDLDVEVAPARRTPVRASRRFTLREGGSEITEVFGEGERRLLLSIRGEAGTRPVVRRLASVGEPVLLRVEIERVEGERSVALETNDLHTFVGEPVEYSFDFGGEDERMRLVLTPLSISGSIAQVRAQVSGRLPGGAGPIVLSRDHRFAASRGATSSVEVVAGDPPAGYRFRITPEF